MFSFLHTVLLILITWMAGFWGFAWHVNHLSPPSPIPKAQGIAVFTGGSDRMREGLKLLSQGYGEVLLISGVNVRVKRGDIGFLQKHKNQVFRPNITLGHEAYDTTGNAEEAAQWAQELNISKIILVTSSYHMPRSLAEVHALLPHAKIIPYPVVPPRWRRMPWWQSPNGPWYMMSEYNKFLFVKVRQMISSIFTIIMKGIA